MRPTSALRAALLLALALALVGAGRASPVAAGGDGPLIRVTGTGRVAVRPDTALVEVGAEAREPTLAAATADVARRMTAVLARVRALGVADQDIATVAWAIDPLQAPRRTEDQPARIVGYRALNVVQVKVRDLERVGAVVDAAVAAGANVLRGLHFTVDDPAPLEARARAMAVASAAARARQLASAAGVRLGELVRLTEGAPPPRPLGARDVRAALAVAPGPVEAGELEVTVTVEAQYRIGP
jgi:hypothetical protein